MIGSALQSTDKQAINQEGNNDERTTATITNDCSNSLLIVVAWPDRANTFGDR